MVLTGLACFSQQFYTKRGWQLLPAFHLSLFLYPTQVSLRSVLGVTRSRPLGKNGIAHLCEQDVSALTANLLALEPGAKPVVVLPTHDLASWLHARAEFISEKVNATYPETKGSIK
jgi:hypothetical protein